MKKLITAFYLPIYTLGNVVKKSGYGLSSFLKKMQFSFPVVFRSPCFSFCTPSVGFLFKNIQPVQRPVKNALLPGIVLLEPRLQPAIFLWQELLRLPILKMNTIITPGQQALAFNLKPFKRL